MSIETGFINLENATIDQKFMLNLHERILKLEEENIKLNTQKKLDIPETSTTIYEKLIINKNKYERLGSINKCQVLSNGKNMIPKQILEMLPSNCIDLASYFVFFTREPYKCYNIFDQAIHIVIECSTKITPEIIAWIDELIEENIKKLSN